MQIQELFNPIFVEHIMQLFIESLYLAKLLKLGHSESSQTSN